MEERFELKVEDVFHISGRGYVVSGRIGQGRVRVGDKLLAQTSGGEQACTVTGIHLGKDLVGEAGTGVDVGLLLRGFDPQKLKDASGVPVWKGSTPVELVLRHAGAASTKVLTIEESIARARGKEKPWWRFW